MPHAWPGLLDVILAEADVEGVPWHPWLAEMKVLSYQVRFGLSEIGSESMG